MPEVGGNRPVKMDLLGKKCTQEQEQLSTTSHTIRCTKDKDYLTWLWSCRRHCGRGKRLSVHYRTSGTVRRQPACFHCCKPSPGFRCRHRARCELAPPRCTLLLAKTHNVMVSVTSSNARDSTPAINVHLQHCPLTRMKKESGSPFLRTSRFL